MIVTTIKKKYLDDILAGKKTIEYRAYNRYWEKCILERKRPQREIGFICGLRYVRFRIEKIVIIATPPELREVVKTDTCFAIHLGERI